MMLLQQLRFCEAGLICSNTCKSAWMLLLLFINLLHFLCSLFFRARTAFFKMERCCFSFEALARSKPWRSETEAARRVTICLSSWIFQVWPKIAFCFFLDFVNHFACLHFQHNHPHSCKVCTYCLHFLASTQLALKKQTGLVYLLLMTCFKELMVQY